jgi:F1F0 ATPase subunit 2
MSYVAYFFLGAATGLVFLAMLWGSVRLLVSRPRGLRLYALLTPLRFLLLAAVFLLLARQGPLAPLCALAGLVAARAAVLRRLRPAPVR